MVAALLLMAAAPAFGYDIEPKRPLSAVEQLKLARNGCNLVVSGATFAYTFRADNGLIESIKVLGRELLAAPVPDLMLAEQLDPAFSPYFARHEKQAHLNVVSASPDRVVIEADGAYTNVDGKPFPVRYSLRYDLSIDGVILVTLDNTALAPCSLRWLRLSAGSVRPESAQFLNWMPEQASSQSTAYRFQSLAGAKGRVLSGTWIPWIWIGDQNVGLEVTTWDVGSQTYNQLDSTARKDEPAMFGVARDDHAVSWENWLVRRTRVHADKGWTRSGRFALAVTPSKAFDPYYSLLKGAHLGPHQHVSDLTLPAEEQIRTLAANGYDLIVGMANWRSGEYVPLNEADLRRTIGLCHKYGIKIIPYVTLVDLSHATREFREHGEEWAIEPGTEFAMNLRPDDLAGELAWRNRDELETTLMCPGAKGWREHWKRQIDRIVRDYDFDGIYFDFWYGRMVCENTRHGCGGRFRSDTVLGSREMLVYASNRLKAKNPHAVIKANTNTLATALITSLVDLRLVGEATDAAAMDPVSRQWLFSSHRLGEPTEFLWDDTAWKTPQRAWFASLVNFLPNRYERPEARPRSAFDDFDVFRSFDDGTGRWSLGIAGQSPLRAQQAEVAVNVVERGGAMLASLIDTGAGALTAEVPVGPGRLAFEPLTDRPVEISQGVLKVQLAPETYRHVLLVPQPAAPKLLYALGARRPPAESFDARSRKLTLSAEASDGALLRFAVYSRTAPARVTDAHGVKIPFDYDPAAALVRFTVRHVPREAISIVF